MENNNENLFDNNYSVTLMKKINLILNRLTKIENDIEKIEKNTESDISIIDLDCKINNDPLLKKEEQKKNRKK